MGKSWKEKPAKYRNNRDFQKKFKKKNNKSSPVESEKDWWYSYVEGQEKTNV
jgi:hypothetical protein